MARQLVPANDADDLASDAFAKVLDALRGGGGPDISFRAYLLTTVRRVHVDRIRSGPKVQTTDDIAAYEREPESFDDPTVTGFESGAAAKAFASLPERWQAVLWHTEVEGEKPAAIAPLLGLTANGVSALAYRAREGLRQAYLQQHLADVAGDRCRWTTERLGAYVRGGLTKRENQNVREHLDDCAKCTAVYLELVEVNSALPALLAPALLGTAGIGYLAAASGAKVGLVGFFVTGWQKVTENSTRTAVSARRRRRGRASPPYWRQWRSPATTLPRPPSTSRRRSRRSSRPSRRAEAHVPPAKPPVKPPTVKPRRFQPDAGPDQRTNERTDDGSEHDRADHRADAECDADGPDASSDHADAAEADPTTPVLDEGLVTISIPRGGGSPVLDDPVARAGVERRRRHASG